MNIKPPEDTVFVRSKCFPKRRLSDLLRKSMNSLRILSDGIGSEMFQVYEKIELNFVNKCKHQEIFELSNDFLKNSRCTQSTASFSEVLSPENIQLEGLVFWDRSILRSITRSLVSAD